ncbi:hypothetical protein BS78_03G089200 [Paspalum vaginatum]|nr:hypothetical protein BS78_03G089200 [Paspalum vaginatum]
MRPILHQRTSNSNRQGNRRRSSSCLCQQLRSWMTIRRFVNVVSESRADRVHSLHRLDVSDRLLYPSRAQPPKRRPPPKQQQQRARTLGCRSWRRCLRRRSSSARRPRINLWVNSRLELFGLLSPDVSDGMVLCTNNQGHALLYESGSRSCTAAPAEPLPGQGAAAHRGLRHPPTWPLAPRRSKTSTSCARTQGQTSAPAASRCSSSAPTATTPPWSANAFWRWETLPAPPFIDDPDYEPGIISSHTVAECGRTICFSSAAQGVGTICFDTVKREWRRPRARSLAGLLQRLRQQPLCHLGHRLCPADGGWRRRSTSTGGGSEYAWRDLVGPDDEWRCIGLYSSIWAQAGFVLPSYSKSCAA